MTKDNVLKAMINLIDFIAKVEDLEVVNKGTGHAYDKTVWKGYLKDESGIPNIIAKKDSYSIELDSYLDSPRLCIRDKRANKGEDMIVIVYSDAEYSEKEKNYKHTGRYHVSKVRVDGRGNYKELINRAYRIIDIIEDGVS